MGFMKPEKPPKAPEPVRDNTEVAESDVDVDGVAQARRRVAKKKTGHGRQALRIPLSGSGGSGGLNTPGV